MAWTGSTRAPLAVDGVVPGLETPLRAWVGVGGSPDSVARAACYGIPLMLAIIGGDPMRFAPYVDLYGRAFARMGLPVPPVGVHSHGHVAETDAQARDELWPDYRRMRDRIGAERGWPPMRRAEFDAEADSGSLYVGTPETVARRMAETIRGLGLSRFDLKYSAGALSHDRLMRCIALYGTRVVPLVRDMLAG